MGLEEIAAEVGRLFGTTQKHAHKWLEQRQTLLEALGTVRDKSDNLMSQLLGGGAPFTLRQEETRPAISGRELGATFRYAQEAQKPTQDVGGNESENARCRAEALGWPQEKRLEVRSVFCNSETNGKSIGSSKPGGDGPGTKKWTRE
jgi:hypothetical protein